MHDEKEKNNQLQTEQECMGARPDLLWGTVSVSFMVISESLGGCKDRVSF